QPETNTRTRRRSWGSGQARIQLSGPAQTEPSARWTATPADAWSEAPLQKCAPRARASWVRFGHTAPIRRVAPQAERSHATAGHVDNQRPRSRIPAEESW